MIITAACGEYFSCCTCCGMQWQSKTEKGTEICPSCGVKNHSHVDVQYVNDRKNHDCFVSRIHKLEAKDTAFSCEMEITKTVFNAGKTPFFTPIKEKTLSMSMDLSQEQFHAQRNGKDCRITEPLLREFVKCVNLRSFPASIFRTWGEMQGYNISDYQWFKTLLQNRRVAATLWDAGDHDLVFLSKTTDLEDIDPYAGDVYSMLKFSPELFEFILDWWPYFDMTNTPYWIIRKYQTVVSDPVIIQLFAEMFQVVDPTRMSYNPGFQMLYAIEERPAMDPLMMMKYAKEQMKNPHYGAIGMVLNDYVAFLNAHTELADQDPRLFPEDLQLECLLMQNNFNEKAQNTFIQRTLDPEYKSFGYETDAYILEPICDLDDLVHLNQEIPLTNALKLIHQPDVRFHKLIRKGLISQPMALVVSYQYSNRKCLAECFSAFCDQRFSRDAYFSLSQKKFLWDWMDKKHIKEIKY